MNNYNTLLVALDKVYGHDENNNSTFKPVKRYFDQVTGEMITVIEYKSKKHNEVVVKNNRPTLAQKNRGLLQNILNQNKSEPKTKK